MTALERLRGKRVWVTGATGFLGRAACQRLREAGCEVHGTSRRPPEEGPSSIRWWKADLSGAGVAAEVLSVARPDIIWHFAGLTDGRPDADLLVPTFVHNAEATLRLLVAAMELGCERFVYCASMEEPDVGDAAAIPYSPYGASKWVGSVYSRMFQRTYGLPVVLVRPYLVYGPGQPDSKLIPYVIRSMIRGETPKLTSCQRRVDAVFIDDVMDGFLAATNADDVLGRTLDLGTGMTRALREIVEKLAEQVGEGASPEFGGLRDRPREGSPAANSDETFRLIGWRATCSLEDGLRRTVAWYQERL
jgi:nucleoside-diphosphate-sugar epimerase